MELYEHKLTLYEQQIREYETKIKKLEQASSSESIRVSQKSIIDSLARKQLEDSIKLQLQQLHQLDITHKDAEISKYKEALNRVEKKLLDKDCECISLLTKVRKLDGANELNLKKIMEYEKLLNHYQLNCSVDMPEGSIGGSVLDRSLCQEYEAVTSRCTTGVDESGRKSTFQEQNREPSTITCAENRVEIRISKIEL
jgi:hypothetical protein